jgi:hypothetical protein
MSSFTSDATLVVESRKEVAADGKRKKKHTVECDSGFGCVCSANYIMFARVIITLGLFSLFYPPHPCTMSLVTFLA